ncbi:MAG: hypothetical protein AABW67_04065 [Nanoarchaeota archaeon]
MNLQQIILSTILLFAGCTESLKKENNKNPIYQKPIHQNPIPAPEKAPIIVNYSIPKEKTPEPIEFNIENKRYSFIPAKTKYESNTLNVYDANGTLTEKIYDFNRNGNIGDVLDSYTTYENKCTETTNSENKCIETTYTTAFILHKDPDFKKWMLNENPTKADLKQAFDKANKTYSMFLKMMEGKYNREEEEVNN